MGGGADDDLERLVAECLTAPSPGRAGWVERLSGEVGRGGPDRVQDALARLGSTADELAQRVFVDAWSTEELRERRRSAVSAWEVGRRLDEACALVSRLLPRTAGIEAVLADALLRAPAGTREAAARLLAEMTPGDATLDALVAASRSGFVRPGSQLPRALAAAARARPERDLLSRMLASGDARERLAACHAAQRVGTAAAHLAPRLREVLEEPRLVGAAALALAFVAPHDAETGEALLQAWTEGGVGGRFSKKALRQAIEIVGASQPRLASRWAAVAATRQRVEPADDRTLPQLVAALLEGDEDEAWRAARTLRSRPRSSYRADEGSERIGLRALARLVEIDAHDRDLSARHGPESWRTSRLSRRRHDVIEALIEQVGRSARNLDPREAAVLLESGSPRLVRAGALVLASHPQAAAGAMDRLLPVLRDGPRVVTEVENAACAAMAFSAPALDRVRQELRASESWRVQDAARLLERLGPAARPAVEDLLELLDRRDVHVVEAAASCVARLAHEDDRVSEAVVKASRLARSQGGRRLTSALVHLLSRPQGPHPLVARELGL